MCCPLKRPGFCVPFLKARNIRVNLLVNSDSDCWNIPIFTRKYIDSRGNTASHVRLPEYRNCRIICPDNCRIMVQDGKGEQQLKYKFMVYPRHPNASEGLFFVVMSLDQKIPSQEVLGCLVLIKIYIIYSHQTRPRVGSGCLGVSPKSMPRNIQVPGLGTEQGGVRWVPY